MEQEGTSEGIV